MELEAFSQAEDFSMATAEKAEKTERTERAEEKEGAEEGRGVGELFSGKITEAARSRKKSRKRQKAVEALPKELQGLADVFSIGKLIEKEIETKIGLSEQRLKNYCIRRFCERFAASRHRPASTVYAGKKSHFTFIQTKKTYMSPEKAEALRLMNVPVDDYTELRGIEIDYAAIREHHLEFKLRQALQKLDVPEEVLSDCFRPRIELKEEFFDSLASILEKNLAEGEKLPQKLYEVINVLGAVNQVKSPEVQGITPEQGLREVLEAEIPPPEPEDFGEAA